jgi:hypothetical protein
VPRWPLLDAPIREAVRVGLPLLQSGFPDCAVALPREDAVAVDVGGNPAPIPTEGACPRCTCAGFPVDHVDLYGIGDTLPAPSPAAEAAFQLDHDARTRDARLALCRVAATGAETLILSGSWSRHPQAEELLREALRLFPEVRAEGDLTPLADWTDDARHRVRKVRFVDTPR